MLYKYIYMWKDEYGYRQLAKEGGEYVRVDGVAIKGRSVVVYIPWGE